ncbi:hypothetical protein V8C34DRAFT_25444 [Trichoderma compactum]
MPLPLSSLHHTPSHGGYCAHDSSSSSWHASHPSSYSCLPVFCQLKQQTLLKTRRMDRARTEFPAVESEVMANLEKSRGLLADMDQGACVRKIASTFMGIRKCVLAAHYTGLKTYYECFEMRLTTRIRTINEAFSRIMLEKGHAREFYTESEHFAAENQPENLEGSAMHDELPPPGRSVVYDEKIHFKIPNLGDEDLGRIVSNSYWCPKPEVGGILEYIQEQYIKARDLELRSPKFVTLQVAFIEQGKKWRDIAHAHASNVVLLVHAFIRDTLRKCCHGVAIFEKLWELLLHDLVNRYARAMQHVDFLLDVEFDSNHPAGSPKCDGTVPEEPPTSSPEETKMAIHNVLHAHYDLARHRFMDAVCQQAMDYYLLYDKDGPLAVLSDNVVLNMTAKQLEMIAGGDLAVKEMREQLTKEIDCLTQALKILRG